MSQHDQCRKTKKAARVESWSRLNYFNWPLKCVSKDANSDFESSSASRVFRSHYSGPGFLSSGQSMIGNWPTSFCSRNTYGAKALRKDHLKLLLLSILRAGVLRFRNFALIYGGPVRVRGLLILMDPTFMAVVGSEADLSSAVGKMLCYAVAQSWIALKSCCLIRTNSELLLGYVVGKLGHGS